MSAAAALETVAEGFGFTEGPVWDAREKRLLFSDIPGNRIHQWSRAGGLGVFRAPSHMANGLAFDHEGRLLACEHATSRVTRTETDGRITVLAAAFGGKELNSPNDIVVKSDGAIYFTDPTYGRVEYYGVPREPQQPVRGAYRLLPDTGALTRLVDDFGQPNGLCFSADERRLYVNDTERGHIRVFDVHAGGGVTGGEVWTKVEGEGEGAPDGMKFDSAENLHCCGPGGIHVFDPAGRRTRVIEVPGGAANFAWGDDDRRSLYITAGSRLLRLRVEVPGRGWS